MKKTDGDESPYRPIACDVYARLELAILRRQHLRLVWHEDNVCFVRTILPVDLETRTGREFLHYRLSAGETGRVRLDRIYRLEPG